MSHPQRQPKQSLPPPSLPRPPPPPTQAPPPTTTTATTTMSPPSPAPPSADLAHFLRIPWCAALLSAPTTTLLPSPSRVPKPSTEDAFFARTLHTGETVPYMLSFSSQRPEASEGSVSSSPSTAPAGAGAGAAAGVEAAREVESREHVSTLFALGLGVSGYPATAHGGVIAALFDEAMGVFMMRLRASAAAAAAADPQCVAGGGVAGSAGVDIVTASLTVDFVRRVETPGVVVVRVWVSERRGRKWVLEGEMVGEGGVVGRGRGVWVEVRAGL